MHDVEPYIFVCVRWDVTMHAALHGVHVVCDVVDYRLPLQAGTDCINSLQRPTLSSFCSLMCDLQNQEKQSESFCRRPAAACLETKSRHFLDESGWLQVIQICDDIHHLHQELPHILFCNDSCVNCCAAVGLVLQVQGLN